MNHSINIEYLHHEPYCNVRGRCLFYFLIKKCSYDVLFFCVFCAKSYWIWLVVTPKSLPTDVEFGLVATPNVIGCGFEPDPNISNFSSLPSSIFFFFSYYFFSYGEEKTNNWTWLYCIV